MKTNTLNNFIYKKENGEVSERTVYVVREPTDLYLTLDLSKFSEDTREFLYSELRRLNEYYNDAIKELGLYGNWRTFKRERITKECELLSSSSSK